MRTSTQQEAADSSPQLKVFYRGDEAQPIHDTTQERARCGAAGVGSAADFTGAAACAGGGIALAKTGDGRASVAGAPASP